MCEEGRRDQGETWWWNEDVKEAIARKKNVHKEICKSGQVQEHEESGKEGSRKSNEGGS